MVTLVMFRRKCKFLKKEQEQSKEFYIIVSLFSDSSGDEHNLAGFKFVLFNPESYGDQQPLFEKVINRHYERIKFL